MADHGFGSGSSREDAVRALLGAGVEAVIAKGFAFICEFICQVHRFQAILTVSDERNQLNMGLFNIVFQDPDFYDNVHEDSVIEINKDEKTITVDGLDRVFHFHHTPIEETLLDAGGVLPLYGEFGTQVFRKITVPPPKTGRKRRAENVEHTARGQTGEFEW